ncbi:MAG: glycosyl hydrolase [Cyclobacteriaceae bacterium]|nr:glycosyl hydrolase [Cyclobacteriaceae bacterium]
MKRVFITQLFFLFLVSSIAYAQKPTSAQQRTNAVGQREKLTSDSYAGGLHFTNIGPTVMSGRVVDLDVNPDNPQEFYVAYASGGLWHTNNFGNSYEPIFDQESVMTIGDIAVDWKSKTIWVGSGESNSSRSSYAGDGMYKSEDGGNTWQHVGLNETQHIGRVVLHPTDKNVAWVAAVGHLYSNNSERGIFKTKDGGKTWAKTLYLNDSTGAIDLIIDPSNPNILYAAMWERSRKAWDFKGNGPSSGIYKSTDGGENWALVTTGAIGFPHDEGVGRIGLAVSYQHPNKIFALLDNQNRRKAEETNYTVTKDKLRTITIDEFLNLDNKEINNFLDRHNFPKEYNAIDIKTSVKSGKVKPKDLVDYLEDANSMLFDTPVKGAEVYVSEDGGKSWSKTHPGYVEDTYYSYGYYFGNIRVSPIDDSKLYIMGVPILRSDDGGETWENINGRNVHVDHHALWVSDKQPGLLINGSDGGIHYSFDDGENWVFANNNAVGQFYSVNVDNAKTYNVYGGLQDNGVWSGPNSYTYSDAWKQYGKYDYQSLMGGDGMQVEIDTRDNNTVITGYQFGNYYRVNKATGESKYIQPVHSLGEHPLRFNWQTPVKLSTHNQDILYMGSNKFHRSMKQGDDWETLSGDLTQGGKKGNVPYGTITTISESPLRFGLIYIGTDDGLIQISKDGGYSWEVISDDLPQNQWISRVEASNYKEGRIYATLNGYRWDNFESMVYVSEDFGKNWTRIGKDLPFEPVNVIKEDPSNANLLFVGTDHAVYASLDRGEHFMLMDSKLPKVAVHDLVVKKDAHDLIIGTHGRSLFKVNIEHLQELDEALLSKPVFVFSLKNERYSDRWGQTSSWNKWYGYNEPTLSVPLFVKEAGKATIQLKTEKGTLVGEETIETVKGLNYVDLSLELKEKFLQAYTKELKKGKVDIGKKLEEKDNGKHYLIQGDYVLTVTQNGSSASTSFKIDPPRERPERKPQKKIP